MRGLVIAVLALAALLPARRHAPRVSSSRCPIREVKIDSNFTGTALTLFGVIERDARTVGAPPRLRCRRRRPRPARGRGDAARERIARHLGEHAVVELSSCAVLLRGDVDPSRRRGNAARRPPPPPASARRHTPQSAGCGSRAARRTRSSARRSCACKMARASISTCRTRSNSCAPTICSARASGFPPTSASAATPLSVFVFADGALVANDRQGFCVAKIGIRSSM